MDFDFNDFLNYAAMNMLHAQTYEARLVAHDDRPNFTVDTTFVMDREWLYETAIQHDHYNEGEWIVVDCASTKEEAQKNHDKWVDYLEHTITPDDTIVDIYTGDEFLWTQYWNL